MSGKVDWIIQTAVEYRKHVKSGKHDRHNTALFALFKAVDEANLKPGEMTFTLRSQDRVSAQTIKAWLTFAEQQHAPDPNLNKVRQVLRKWEKWQSKLANSLLVKVPD